MQLEFPSLDFPGRTVLYPHECAEKLGVSLQHVLDLIEEGKLGAINIAGANPTSRKFWRIPIEEWRAYLARNYSLTTEKPQ